MLKKSGFHFAASPRHGRHGSNRQWQLSFALARRLTRHPLQCPSVAPLPHPMLACLAPSGLALKTQGAWLPSGVFDTQWLGGLDDRRLPHLR
jgi:hypothetical protein